MILLERIQHHLDLYKMMHDLDEVDMDKNMNVEKKDERVELIKYDDDPILTVDEHRNITTHYLDN